MGYLDNDLSSDPLRRRLRRLSRAEILEEATEFIELFYREQTDEAPGAEARIREVRRQIQRGGFYEHTPEELAFGARVAWRNHGRCIGRLHWKSLEVFDCRSVVEPDEMAAQIFDHMRLAGSGNRIRAIISIFSPVRGSKLPAYIENGQVAQYAGYMDGSAGILGDPQNIEFTRIASSLGWAGPIQRSPFDLLPLILRDRTGRRCLYEIPPGVISEVRIEHPTLSAIRDLGLRWYAVPLVSDMVLTIGGMEYPCAPFNGHYMATEIANRNLVDSFRYDRLPAIRDALELNAGDPLWRDVALLELNRAVLHSFDKAGVTIVDHYSASEQFVEFSSRESAAGRPVSGEWSWVVPPQSPAACPVFHRQMHDARDVPNFYRSRAIDGGNLRISRLSEQRSVLQQRLDRAKRKWRNWRRRKAA